MTVNKNDFIKLNIELIIYKDDSVDILNQFNEWFVNASAIDKCQIKKSEITDSEFDEIKWAYE
jgi:hypothetical protein